MVAPLQGTATGQSHGITKVRYTHDAMIDLILAKPNVSQNELAAAFGFSVGWVSRVMGSDAFQARLAERKEEVVDPAIRGSFEERLRGLADQSLAVITAKLEATGSPDIAMKALELSTKALGMGARPQNITQTNNYVVALPPKATNEQDWASKARKDVIDLGAPQIVDVEIKGS